MQDENPSEYAVQPRIGKNKFVTQINQFHDLQPIIFVRWKDWLYQNDELFHPIRRVF